MPTVELDKTVTTEKKGRRLLTLHAVREDDQVLIEIQSDLDWAKYLKKREATTPRLNIGGVKCWESKELRLVSVRNGMWNFSGDLFPEGTYLNLSPFLAVGLREGVTLKFPALPVSGDRLNEWAQGMKAAARELFSNYVKPVDITVAVTTESQNLEEL